MFESASKKLLLIAGAFLTAGIVHVFGNENMNSDKEQLLEKKYEESLKFEEEMKKKNPEAINLQQKKTLEARYNAYQKALKENGQQIKMIKAMNPPECRYYSTEGLYILPLTLVHPYPEIAHVNTSLNYKFPREIGGCSAQFVQVYGEHNYSIRYASDNTIVDIYVYDMPKTTYSDDALCKNELNSVAGAFLYSKRNVKIENFFQAYFLNERIPVYYFFAQFDIDNSGSDEKNNKAQSFSLIFSKNQKHIKFRISKTNCDRKSFEQFVNNFLVDFDKKVILDSQTRKKKFEYKKSYPIVFPN